MTKNIYAKCCAKLRKSTIDKMNELVNKSQINEYGGTFCLDRESKVNLRNICKGDACGISIENGCQQGEIHIGDFHSHPHFKIPPFPNDIPSPEDWSLWTRKNYFLTCLGTEKITKCYQKKRDLTPEEINRIKGLITNMEITRSAVDIKYPDSQQSSLRRFKKYNEELEEYYHKFSPEECSE